VTGRIVPDPQPSGIPFRPWVVDATVRTELVFQEAQQNKRLASEALERGDRKTAKRLLGEAASSLGMVAAAAPPGAQADLNLEINELAAMGEQVDGSDTAYTSKLTRASYHDKNRKRGRRPGQ